MKRLLLSLSAASYGAFAALPQDLWLCHNSGARLDTVRQAPRNPDPAHCQTYASARVKKDSTPQAVPQATVAPPPPPSDIYKCFDQNGQVNFVNEKDSHNPNLRGCHFFSRSFASVKRDLRLGKNAPAPPVSDASLRCSGHGEIVFAGQVHRFGCTQRSLNFSKGSTGGSVRLGAQVATVQGHKDDYFGTSGNCGGTIRSDDGRVFHLEPTKYCPKAIRAQASILEDFMRRRFSVDRSAAFRERQKVLAETVNTIARAVGIDPFLLHAIISVESAYKIRARSRVGAMGLMQLMPATARRFQVDAPYIPEQNIRGGALYLKYLLNLFNGNLPLVIAAYNAGEGNVRRYGYRVPPFIETRAYVPKVLDYYSRYRQHPKEIGL